MNVINYWCDRPVQELSRDELLEVVAHCCDEIRSLREDHTRMRPHVDWTAVLLADRPKASA